MRQPELPLLEPILGGLWWTVGATALDPGAGTVVLAGGLALAGWLAIALWRRHRNGAALPPGGARKLVQTVAVVLVLIIGSGVALGALGLGELAVPVACAITGLALFGLSSQLAVRALMGVGAAMLLLAAVGALLALNSTGLLYPQGLVGLVSGALFLVCGAHRGGLLAEARRGIPVGRNGGAPAAELRPTAQLPLPGEQAPARPGGPVGGPTGSFSAWSAQQQRGGGRPASGPGVQGRRPPGR